MPLDVHIQTHAHTPALILTFHQSKLFAFPFLVWFFFSIQSFKSPSHSSSSTSTNSKIASVKPFQKWWNAADAAGSIIIFTIFLRLNSMETCFTYLFIYIYELPQRFTISMMLSSVHWYIKRKMRTTYILWKVNFQCNFIHKTTPAKHPHPHPHSHSLIRRYLPERTSTFCRGILPVFLHSQCTRCINSRHCNKSISAENSFAPWYGSPWNSV